MQRMSKIHIWIGFTTKTQEEFDKYFDQKNAFMFDDKGNEKGPSEIILSQFSKDVGKSHAFDEDFLNIYYNPNSDDLQLALEELSDTDLLELLKDICSSKGITKANAMFFYTDAELQVNDLDKKYNDLIYLGVFDWDY